MESSQTLVQPARARDPQPPSQARTRILAGADGQREGELLLDRYRLLKQLGEGGFGVVWRAHDELLHRDVALKRVWLGPDGDGDRARREALANARLKHPAIVALYEACAHEHAFYLISELVEGDTLATLIAEEGLDDEEILEIGLALAGALEHAHAHGVIHRDIKPQNVLVPAPAGEPARPPAAVAAAKLADFGGASLVGEEVLTRTGDVLGTLAYMAPEQSEGREVGVEADLYSLALVVYEALSGVNPVRAATPAATVRRIGGEQPPLARMRGELPSALTRAIDRALAPAPERRGTLQELRFAFEEALELGLARPRWRRARAAGGTREQPATRAPTPDHDRAPRAPMRAPVPSPQTQNTLEQRLAARGERSRLPAPPRVAWVLLALALALWQAFAGHTGVSLLVCAAAVPLLALCGPAGAQRAGIAWLGCALAPALGYAGLAAAWPALAGQAWRWRERAALGALGYWWLRLSEPLWAHRLWLGAPVGTPVRSAWESSPALAVSHVIAPLASLGVLLGALGWALAAAVLPWLARRRSVTRDLLALAVWSAALVLATPALDAGLRAHGAHAHPRGLLLGALAGALAALAACALRAPA